MPARARCRYVPANKSLRSSLTPPWNPMYTSTGNPGRDLKSALKKYCHRVRVRPDVVQVIDPRDMDTSEFGTASTLRRDLDIKTKGRMVNTIISKHSSDTTQLFITVPTPPIEECGHIDIRLGHFSRPNQLCATPHVPCNMLYLVPVSPSPRLSRLPISPPPRTCRATCSTSCLSPRLPVSPVSPSPRPPARAVQHALLRACLPVSPSLPSPHLPAPPHAPCNMLYLVPMPDRMLTGACNPMLCPLHVIC